MKRGNWVIRLVFSILGGVYLVLGAGFLGYGIYAAGDVTRIFTLPEEELALAIIGMVFAVLGVIFLGVAGVMMLVHRRQQRLREELRTYGTRVKGVVTSVQLDRTVRVNRRCPYRAMVRCSLPLGERTLRSPMLWEHVPTVGEEVTVLYDPMDDRKVVIEFPEEG